MNRNNPKQISDQLTQELSLDEILAAIERDETAAKEATQFVADEDFVTDRLRAEFVAQVYTVMKQRNVKNPAALAKLTGFSRTRIGAILQEKGNISLRTIAKIALALDAPVNLQFGEVATAQDFSAKSVAKEIHLLVHHYNSPEPTSSDSWKTQQHTFKSMFVTEREQHPSSSSTRKAMEQGV